MSWFIGGGVIEVTKALTVSTLATFSPAKNKGTLIIKFGVIGPGIVPPEVISYSAGPQEKAQAPSSPKSIQASAKQGAYAPSLSPGGDDYPQLQGDAFVNVSGCEKLLGLNRVGVLATQAGLIGHLRQQGIDNFNANIIAHLDDPLGVDMAAERRIFVGTLAEFDLENKSDEAKYALMIQLIQGRFKFGGYTYGRDPDSEGQRDYWSTPAQSLGDGGQDIDCEDFSFLAQGYGEILQQELGLGGDFRVHLGLVDHDNDRGHAICVYHAADGNQYVIDGTFFDSATGDPSKIQTLAEYTEDRNFLWDTASNGHLKEGYLSPSSDGETAAGIGPFVPNFSATEKPADVVQAEAEFLKINQAVAARKDIESESGGIQGVASFFSKERESLGDLSILELGTVILGPVTILTSILGLRKEIAKLERVDAFYRARKWHDGSGTIRDKFIHIRKRNMAGLRAVADIVRYGAFLLTIASLGAAFTPVVALGASALRFFVGAVESVDTGIQKRRRYKRQKAQEQKLSDSLSLCPQEAQDILISRMAYKNKKNRLKGAWGLGIAKTLAYLGATASAVVGLKITVMAGTTIATNPLFFGPALVVFAILVLARGGEAAYRGFLLRAHKASLNNDGQTLIEKRLGAIRDSKRSRFSRIGGAINLVGWVTDFIDDRTRGPSRPLTFLAKLLAAPFYGLQFLFEGKSFNEEEVFNRIKEQFLRMDIDEQQREAVLKTAARYYGLRESSLAAKWMSQDELLILEVDIGDSNESTHPLVRFLRSSWKKDKKRDFAIDDIAELRSRKAEVVDLVKPKFGGLID